MTRSVFYCLVTFFSSVGWSLAVDTSDRSWNMGMYLTHRIIFFSLRNLSRDGNGRSVAFGRSYRSTLAFLPFFAFFDEIKVF